ncbi:AMP-binding protein [Labilibaculum sp. DW002]|uniref:AMP-binding protein n=1 Tax=Paralabilibaculum antarcticum TaxID=2912572 RepID=A0ABT5VY98_9BACT|nr:AMP-binding protein [Labilibaculum sp. DW002]MDE5420287.1 AMP-binding protein [Labilibaculum sp. DW002]
MKEELTINGKYFAGEALYHHCEERVNNSSFQWERDVYAFILEWFDSKDSVIAKTSGSTGVPKEVTLSKQKMLNSAKLTGDFFGFENGQSALLCLSANYIAGKMMIVRAFLWQLNLILVDPNGNPLESINTKVDFAAMVPLQLVNSLKSPSTLGLINNLLIGGGAVDFKLEKQIQNLTTRCFSSYGMTETVSHVAIKPLNGPNQSKYFKGLGDVTFSLDERSCLKINAPQVLSLPIVTNDVVDLIDDKQFTWLGRYDNVVNSGGIKLFPETIEAKLQNVISAPFFLAGVPDEKLGQKLVLLVENPIAAENDKLKLQVKIKGLLDKFEQARDIFFIKEFIKTPNGKLKREATLSVLNLKGS